MTPADNLARARGWVDHFIQGELLSFLDEAISQEELFEAMSRMLVAAVRAKGKHISLELQGQGMTPKWIVEAVLEHAADVPKVP